MGLLTWSRQAPSLLRERWRKNKWALVYQVFNVLYDRVFYAFAMSPLGWGLAHGGLIAVIGSFVQCSVMFYLYDRMKLDWLSAQELRDLESKPDLAWYERALVWFGQEKKKLSNKIASYIVFLAASTQIDPLIVAIHFQKQHFQGLRLGDWGILLSALIAANLWSIIEIGLLVIGATYAVENWETILTWANTHVIALADYLYTNRDEVFRLLFGRRA